MAAAALGLAAAVSFPVVGSGQALRLQPGDSARFSESVRTTVTTRSGAAVRERRVARSATYSFRMSHDTLVATADTIALTETVDGVSRDIDVDAVIGGKWWIVTRGDGIAVVQGPFVPADIAEVSDLAVAMHDFLPPSPPRLAVNARITVGERRWTRMSDSSSVERYRWSESRRRDTNRLVADSVPLSLDEELGETLEMAWRSDRGALTWRRTVTSVTTTRVRGRVVRAEVGQVSSVRRDF